jgi:RNA polymerase sigma factor (sigma-70 family)
MPAADPLTLLTSDPEAIVARLNDPADREAWQMLDDWYGPLVIGYARRFGLSPQCAEDVKQESMLGLASALRNGGFDPGRGSLRHLLFGIARRKIVDRLRRTRVAQEIQCSADDHAFLDRLPGDDQLEAAWERDWSLGVLRQCLEEARLRFTPPTYRAFILKDVERRSTADVAEMLGKTPNAVDIAASRVRTYLRQVRPQMESMF